MLIFRNIVVSLITFKFLLFKNFLILKPLFKILPC